jgi:bifunctional DNase/RNase
MGAERNCRGPRTKIFQLTCQHHRFQGDRPDSGQLVNPSTPTYANAPMSKSVIPVQVRAVLPVNSGRAVFIGNPQKVFVIYVDEGVGTAITMFMQGTPKERPLTHDLMAHLLTALGAKVERVIINDLKSETYFARLIIGAENEVLGKKIIELDARPSDCLALAIQQRAPIYVCREVWDEVEDRSDVLRSLEENNPPHTESGEPGSESP